MRPFRNLALAFALIAGLAACDRDVAGPAIGDGEVDALLVSAGLRPAAGEYTLPSLLHDAIRTVQRERGTEAARLQLERLRTIRGAVGPAGADTALSGQIGLVLDLLGAGTVERAIQATSARLTLLEASIDSAGDASHSMLESSARAHRFLAAARLAQQEGEARTSLTHAVHAAEAAAELRRDLLLQRRVASLPELFGQARARIDTVAGASRGDLLARHERLTDEARIAMGRGDRREAHRALTAQRAEEIRLTIGTLGPDVAGQVSADVARALKALEPQLGSNARLQRMHRAAHDLQVRSEKALLREEPDVALDLASHAASLANALMLVVTFR